MFHFSLVFPLLCFSYFLLLFLLFVVLFFLLLLLKQNKINKERQEERKKGKKERQKMLIAIYIYIPTYAVGRGFGPLEVVIWSPKRFPLQNRAF